MNEERLWWELEQIRKEQNRIRGSVRIAQGLALVAIGVMLYYLPYIYVYVDANYQLLTSGEAHVEYFVAWRAAGAFSILGGTALFLYGLITQADRPKRWIPPSYFESTVWNSGAYPQQYPQYQQYQQQQRQENSMPVPAPPPQRPIKKKKVKTTADGRPIYKKKPVKKKKEDEEELAFEIE